MNDNTSILMPTHSSVPTPITSPTRTTAEYQALDAAHHLHPFSDMAVLAREGSRVIVRAEGAHLWDADGNRMIDGMAGLWCVNIGYGRQELADAAYRQMQTLPYYNTFFKTTHPQVIELSALLTTLTPPGFSHFFYCSSGSEGNDTALRLAYQYWRTLGHTGKRFVISRKNAYHGSTIAGATLGGMASMHEQMPSKLENVLHIDQPYWFAEGGDLTPEAFGVLCARQLETQILEVGAEHVAAFIGEPFQGAGGVIFPPSTYWPEIERICRKYDVLLIADEVIGGFGRTGEWFAQTHFGFKPDLMTMAKGLTSGYLPMGAVGLHDRVAEVIIGGGAFHHGLTYSGHPVAAAVAIANLTLLRDEGIVERVKDEVGPYFQKRLRDALEDHPLIGEISGVGLVAGLQLARERQSRERFGADGTISGEDVAGLCRDAAMQHGLVMRPTGDRLLLSPPLIVNADDVEEIVGKARRAFDQVFELLRKNSVP